MSAPQPTAQPAETPSNEDQIASVEPKGPSKNELKKAAKEAEKEKKKAERAAQQAEAAKAKAATEVVSFLILVFHQ